MFFTSVLHVSMFHPAVLFGTLLLAMLLTALFHFSMIFAAWVFSAVHVFATGPLGVTLPYAIGIIVIMFVDNGGGTAEAKQDDQRG